jgi:hypothetical protein
MFRRLHLFIKPTCPAPPASPFEKAKMPSLPETKPARPLTLLSVVIPARDEEGLHCLYNRASAA